MLESAAFGGAALPSPYAGNNGSLLGASETGYAGTTTTATDEAGVQKVGTVDGLGRLVGVQDATGTTSCQYDGLWRLRDTRS